MTYLQKNVMKKPGEVFFFNGTKKLVNKTVKLNKLKKNHDKKI